MSKTKIIDNIYFPTQTKKEDIENLAVEFNATMKESQIPIAGMIVFETYDQKSIFGLPPKVEKLNGSIITQQIIPEE